MATTHDRLAAAVGDAGSAYHRLVLLVGPARSGKTEALRRLGGDRGWPRVNLNRELSALLIDYPKRQRALKLPDLASQMAAAQSGDVILIDNIELLFAPELAVDPLRLLQGLSRNRIVIASWRGAYDGEQLTYAEPGHPEWRRYTHPEAAVVSATQPATNQTDNRQDPR